MLSSAKSCCGLPAARHQDALKKAEDGGGAALTAVDQVVIVGHSKGAGVGQLLAAMLLGAPCLPPQRQSAADCGAVPAFRASHESATFHVSLRAFAPPRVATVQVQELMRISQGPGDSLVGVVNATDVVPRLSRHTIAELIQSAMTPYPSLGDAPTEVRNIAERVGCSHVLVEAAPNFARRNGGSFRSQVQRNVSQIPTLDVMCDVAFIHPDGRHLLALRDAHKFLSHVVFTDKVVHDHRASSHVRALERLLGTGGGRIETVGAYRVKTGGAAAVGLLRHFCRACCCCADSGSTGTTVAPAEASK